MKITDIKVHYLEIPLPVELLSTWGHGRPEQWHGVALAEVRTDEGLTGYGAAEAMWGWGPVHKAIVEEMLKPRLPGQGSLCHRTPHHGYPRRAGAGLAGGKRAVGHRGQGRGHAHL